jgi:hypothetical protein
MYGAHRNDGRNHHTVDGQGNHWSYETIILQRHGDVTIGNVTQYSTTTSKHQTHAGSRGADVLVNGIPAGTKDLRPYVGKDGHTVVKHW